MRVLEEEEEEVEVAVKIYSHGEVELVVTT